MRRPSPWLILVVILLGAFILREDRLQRVEDGLLAWFLENSESTRPPAQVAQVEIGRDDFQRLTPEEERKPLPKGQAARRSLSPLEYALFLQAILEFQPTVIGIQPVVIWRARDKTQEQVFIDQAMRVPRLLIAIELGGKGPNDLAPDDLPTLPNVSGPRGYLAQFSGVKRQPDEDIRLISTPGFTNLPNGWSDRIRVPLLFEYRGEIVPSFTLQAIMLWLRLTPADVKVELGGQISLPNGWKIPLHRDGTTTINPVARQSVHRLTFSELLLAAQEHEKHLPPTRDVGDLKSQIILLRIADDPLQPPDVFATAIATIQGNVYVRPASKTIAWIIILFMAVLSCFLRMISRTGFFLGAIMFSAGWGMIVLAVLSRNHIWLPTFLPLMLLWFLVVVRFFSTGSTVKHEIAVTG
jgi:hypothetical protein